MTWSHSPPAIRETNRRCRSTRIRPKRPPAPLGALGGRSRGPSPQPSRRASHRSRMPRRPRSGRGRRVSVLAEVAGADIPPLPGGSRGRTALGRVAVAVAVSVARSSRRSLRRPAGHVHERQDPRPHDLGVRQPRGRGALVRAISQTFRGCRGWERASSARSGPAARALPR